MNNRKEQLEVWKAYTRQFRTDTSEAFDDEGQWITTENGHHVHINEEGQPDKGNPHVLAKMKGEGSSKSERGSSKSTADPGKDFSPKSKKQMVADTLQKLNDAGVGEKVNYYRWGVNYQLEKRPNGKWKDQDGTLHTPAGVAREKVNAEHAAHASEQMLDALKKGDADRFSRELEKAPNGTEFPVKGGKIVLTGGEWKGGWFRSAEKTRFHDPKYSIHYTPEELAKAAKGESYKPKYVSINDAALVAHSTSSRGESMGFKWENLHTPSSDPVVEANRQLALQVYEKYGKPI